MPPTVKLAGDAFGEEHAALMFGWIAASHQIGALAVAWLAGILRTQTGDYSLAFFLSGLLSILAAFLAAFVGSGSKRNLLAEPKESAWGEKDLNEKGYGWRTRLTIFAVIRLAVLLWALLVVTASARGADLCSFQYHGKVLSFVVPNF